VLSSRRLLGIRLSLLTSVYQVQIAHVAKLIDLPLETVENTLSQVCSMINPVGLRVC